MSRRKMVVIGAGPKSLAIAAKNEVLSELGFKVPEIIIIEKNEIASHWTGNNGYTNGKMELGTRPEKDVGFPYDTRSFSPEMNKQVNEKMMSYSWGQYLVENNLYSDYIDRGKPFPLHSEYASYLRWVAKKVNKNTQFIYGQVVAIQLIEKKQYCIRYLTSKGTDFLFTDGLVVTGPGTPTTNFSVEESEKVFDIEGFWKSFKCQEVVAGSRVALVGAGENSASIANALGDLKVDIKIDIISPKGFVFTRGESFFESRVYSDAKKGHWEELSLEDKENFIKRTDLGVFGVYAQKLLNKRRDIEVIPGKVFCSKKHRGKIELTLGYNHKVKKMSYDFVVFATGFDHLKLLKDVLDKNSQAEIIEQIEVSNFEQRELSNLIASDMSLEGLEAKLHLPMLSRVKQGPGFANLSCLGRLSDQILESYVEKEGGIQQEELFEEELLMSVV